MNTSTNKAGIKRVPTDTFVISSNDVVNYLENQLGFSIIADFTRWTGISANHSYVRMRVVMSPKDITVDDNKGSNYVKKFLKENASGMQFDKETMDILKPFMYPDNMTSVYNQPEALNRMYQYGLFGERLEEVVKFSKLTYSKETNVFRVYLRPERIIADMLANPATNSIDGNMSIVNVMGTNTETLRWEVEVTKNSNFGSTNPDIIDAVFNNHS